ncbi:MAG: glycine--tRNA ligase subunit beta [Alphaproteobacteria bacterium]|nr:glycine--tRNA ligase subunit beta [Alphaproteobacteria bacterium]
MTSDHDPNGAGRGELLLEVLSEEIPARMQRRAIGNLTELLRDKLAAAEIAPAAIHGYVTPRRLVVVAEGIPAAQPDRTEERRGPRVGAPQAAINGFLGSAGVASVEECEIRDTGRGAFYFAIVRRPGRPSAEVLPELVKGTIDELPWPKSMRWPGAAMRWVRPLTSIICLYDGESLPLAIDGIPIGRSSRGHRFLSPGEFCVAGADEYLEKLQHAYVILDPDRRRELIRADLDRRAAELGLRVTPDPGLLDEVTGLAEFPVVLAGAIDPDFMTLPPEVLQTAMRTHQKYFSCVDHDGRAAPHFLFVANNLAEDGGKAIAAGNERVLRARLADARFFWDQDRKVPLARRVTALKQRVYHDKLGSVYDKVCRMEALAAFLVEDIRFPYHSLVTSAEAGVQGNRSDPAAFRGNDEHEDKGELGKLADRAAHLAKADLSTGMVGEFPELQGVIGRYYALADGEDPRVAEAIAEHYKPVGPKDICPSAPASVIVALTDKIDTLTTFFAIGEKPTGSRDPYALRRAALGIIRVILEDGLRISLKSAFTKAAEVFYLQQGVSHWQERVPPLYAELMSFVIERLKVHLREEGVRHDLIAAGFAQAGTAESDIVHLLSRVAALQTFLDTGDGASLLIAYRRASNIVAIEDRKEGFARSSDVDPSQLREAGEQALAIRLDHVGSLAGVLIANERFEEAMAELARLRPSVDEFFDKVTVNTDDANLRENRLRLLARIRDTMNRIADFSQIEG